MLISFLLLASSVLICILLVPTSVLSSPTSTVAAPLFSSVPGLEITVFPNSSSHYQFEFVGGVAVDSAGNIYVADQDTADNGGYGRVVVLSSAGVLLHAFPNASSAATSNYQFDQVFGVAVDSAGNIYVGDSADNRGSGRVVVLSSAGVLLHAFPNASSAATSNYQFDQVFGVAVDSAGNIYVGDSGTADNGGYGRVVVLTGLSNTSNSSPSNQTNSSLYTSFSFCLVTGPTAGLQPAQPASGYVSRIIGHYDYQPSSERLCSGKHSHVHRHIHRQRHSIPQDQHQLCPSRSLRCQHFGK